MRKSFFCILLTVNAVIGGIIGAGFITGKEIYEFFGKDFSVGGVYLTFICFWVFIYIMMQKPSSGKIQSGLNVVVALASIVISGCMVSALDETYLRVFRLSEKVKILSVITVIFVFFMSLNGIEMVEKSCLLLIPFVIVILIIFTLLKTDSVSVSLSPRNSTGLYYPVIYVGFNVLLSSKIIQNSGEKLSPPFKLIASFMVSAILSVCVFVVSNLVQNVNSNCQMPFRQLFENDVKLLIIIDVISIFAIITTLFSSVYTSITFGGINLKFWQKLLIVLISVAISEAGFSAIIEKLYPLLGIVGYAVIFFTYLLPTLFPKGRRERTLLQPKRIV